MNEKDKKIISKEISDDEMKKVNGGSGAFLFDSMLDSDNKLDKKEKNNKSESLFKSI